MTEPEREGGFAPNQVEQILLVLPSTESSEDLFELLVGQDWHPRRDLNNSLNLQGGSGGSQGRFFEAGSLFLKTSLSRRYQSADDVLRKESAQEQLRQILRIYSPQRIWFLCRDQQQQFWACSLCPNLKILRQVFNEDATCDEPWLSFLRCIEMTLRVAGMADIALDCNPNNFGLQQDELYYVDDGLQGPPALVLQILLRLREYPTTPLSVKEAFLRSSCELLEACSPPVAKKVGLCADLESRTLWPPEPSLQHILENLRDRVL